MDEIEVCFRTDENAGGNIESQPRPGVEQKVVAALKIRTSSCKWIVTTGNEWRIEAYALCAYSSFEFHLRSLAQRRSVNGIEVVENRPVGIEKDVHVLTAAPGHVATYAEVLLPEQKIAAERGIGPSADALRSVVRIVKGI